MTSSILKSPSKCQTFFVPSPMKASFVLDENYHHVLQRYAYARNRQPDNFRWLCYQSHKPLPLEIWLQLMRIGDWRTPGYLLWAMPMECYILFSLLPTQTITTKEWYGWNDRVELVRPSLVPLHSICKVPLRM